MNMEQWLADLDGRYLFGPHKTPPVDREPTSIELDSFIARVRYGLKPKLEKVGLKSSDATPPGQKLQYFVLARFGRGAKKNLQDLTVNEWESFFGWAARTPHAEIVRGVEDLWRFTHPKTLYDELGIQNPDEDSIKNSECQICKAKILANENAPFSGQVCINCDEKYLPALVKACIDPFDYAVGLRNGLTLRFEYAEIHGDFVTLHEPEGLPFPCPRGLDVALADILWATDAPNGS